MEHQTFIPYVLALVDRVFQKYMTEPANPAQL